MPPSPVVSNADDRSRHGTNCQPTCNHIINTCFRFGSDPPRSVTSRIGEGVVGSDPIGRRNDHRSASLKPRPAWCWAGWETPRPATCTVRCRMIGSPIETTLRRSHLVVIVRRYSHNLREKVCQEITALDVKNNTLRRFRIHFSQRLCTFILRTKQGSSCSASPGCALGRDRWFCGVERLDRSLWMRRPSALLES